MSEVRTQGKDEETREDRREEKEETREDVRRAIEMKNIAEDAEGRRIRRSRDEFPLPAGQVALPLKMANQAVVMFHIAHREQRPNCEQPAFRVIGVFPNLDEMWRHSEVIGARNCSVWHANTHELVVCCQSTEMQQDSQYCKSQMARLLQLHSQDTKFFDKSVRDRETQPTGTSLAAMEVKVRSRPVAPGFQPRGSKGICDLSRDAYLPRQRFAVILVLRDLRESVVNGQDVAEPCFAVLAVFADIEEATFYAKHTAHKEYSACDIDIIDTCEWLFPETVDREQIQEVYGIKGVNEIMEGRKRDMRLAEEYAKQNPPPNPA